MVNVSDEKIKAAYHLYCEELGLKVDSWNSVFEFSTAFGFSVIYGCLGKLEAVEETFVTEKTAKAIDWCSGPHGATIAKVFKSRRYSLCGKVRAPIIKSFHVLGFAGVTAYEVVMMWWGND